MEEVKSSDLFGKYKYEKEWLETEHRQDALDIALDSIHAYYKPQISAFTNEINRRDVIINYLEKKVFELQKQQEKYNNSLLKC